MLVNQLADFLSQQIVTQTILKKFQFLYHICIVRICPQFLECVGLSSNTRNPPALFSLEKYYMSLVKSQSILKSY